MFASMRRLAAALAVLWVTSSQAAAQPTNAGPQQVPPVKPSEPTLTYQNDHRRNIRGCDVDSDCVSPADVLREFQAERIPPPGGDPWISERTPPPYALRAGKLEAGKPRIVKKPSELRPDAPWLDSLALPDLPVRWSQRLVDFLVFYRDDPRGRAIMAGWLKDQGR